MLLKEKPHITVIMEDEVYNKLINSIKEGNAELFIKTLIDFYDDNKISMPECINLKDYLRYYIKGDTEYRLIRRGNGKDIRLHKSGYDDNPFNMEEFVRQNTKGFYLYKNRIFDLRNHKKWTYDADGYYTYTPYLEEVVSLETIEKIE